LRNFITGVRSFEGTFQSRAQAEKPTIAQIRRKIIA
jgi:hypothetical protein